MPFTEILSVVDNAELVIANGCVLHKYIIQENDSGATGQRPADISHLATCSPSYSCFIDYCIIITYN
jgi:hypothetical protein